MRIRRNFWWWLTTHFFEFWYYYTGALVSLYILHFSQVEIPELAKKAGDQIISGGMDSSIIRDFFIFALLIVMFRTMSRWLFFYPARVQQKNIRLEILQIIKDKHPSLYSDYSFGQIYQIILNDFDRLRGFIGFALLQIGNLIIACIILYPKIAGINKELFVAFIPMFASVIFFSVIMYFFQPYVKKGIEIQGDVQNNIIETFDAKLSVSNFQKEEFFLKKFKSINEMELNYFFKASIGPALSRPLVPLGVAISLLWGSDIIYQNNLGVTTIILFSGFLFLALEPLMFLSWIGVVITSFIPSWKRIKKFIFDLDKETQFKSNIKINDHDYLFQTKLWNGDLEITLKHSRDKIIGVCGATGIGKTFLFNDLVSQLAQKNLDFHYVLQEPHLFDGNLQDNILLGQELTSERKEKIKRLLTLFGFNDLENNLEALLKVEVGEHGKKLSGGQIKRLVLIQSLVSDSDYLIWDDPFSSVDNILEKEIFEVLISEGYLKNKFLILSSHRLTTFHYVDEIYLFKSKLKFAQTNFEDDSLNEFFKYQMDSLS